MKPDKVKIYVLEFILLAFLIFALFVSNIVTRIILSIFLTIYMIVTIILIKKKKNLSIYKKQVTILMLVFGIIYLLVFYLIGLYFGFYEATVKFSIETIFKYIIPLTLIIVSSEITRYIHLSQKTKVSKYLTFISMVIIDLIIYIGAYDIREFDDFMAIVGFILFASISCNLLYNYITVRFGFKGIIIYRLLTILYMYFIPLIPNIYIFFRSFLRMIYPYIMYLILESSYAKTNFAVAYKDKKKNIISNSILLVVMIMIIMLVSCKFKYGIIVIATESMTGAIDKGDAVIYESYDNEKITKGQVIIFKNEDIQVVHRVIDIKEVNGEIRYYTKGDVNAEMDDGYVTTDEIVGTTKLKIKYLGYPTLWIRDIFSI